jgi:hypothetical protein
VVFGYLSATLALFLPSLLAGRSDGDQYRVPMCLRVKRQKRLIAQLPIAFVRLTHLLLLSPPCRRRSKIMPHQNAQPATKKQAISASIQGIVISCQ